MIVSDATAEMPVYETHREPKEIRNNDRDEDSITRRN